MAHDGTKNSVYTDAVLLAPADKTYIDIGDIDGYIPGDISGGPADGALVYIRADVIDTVTVSMPGPGGRVYRYLLPAMATTLTYLGEA